MKKSFSFVTALSPLHHLVDDYVIRGAFKKPGLNYLDRLAIKVFKNILVQIQVNKRMFT